MAEDWHATPADSLVLAELLDGKRVAYEDLRIGDVFRTVRDGAYLHPATFLPADDVYARVDGWPEKNYEQGWGWIVPIFWGELRTIARRSLH